MAVTLRQIAKKANVSLMTASRVVRETGLVSDGTRKRVWKAADQLGYRPNINARALASRKSLLVGILFNEVNYIYATQLMSGIQNALVGQQYAPIFLNHNNPKSERENLELCQARQVDALIVNPWVEENGRSTVQMYTELANTGLPIIEIYGRQIPGLPWVCHDSMAQGRMATEYLQRRGHRRIALFTHGRYRACETQPGRSWDAYEQWQGYLSQMKAAGEEAMVIAPPLTDIVLPRDGTSILYHSALRGAAALFDHPRRPTAVVCYSMHIAYAILTMARERNVRIPQDLSIITAGAGAEVFGKPRLTNVMPQTAELGRLAGNMVLEMIAGKKVESAVVQPILDEADSVSEPVTL